MSRREQFRLGIRSLKEGFTFFWKHPRLWVYALLPFVISVILFAAFFSLFLQTFGDVTQWVLHWIGPLQIEHPESFWMKIANVLLWFVDQLFKLFLFLLGLILLSLVTYLAQMILAGPFNDVISEKVEVLRANFEPPPFRWSEFPKNLARTLLTELQKTVFFLFVPLVLFIINLAPLVGGVVYSIFVVFFGLWNIGFSYVDYPLSRRQMGLRGRLQFALKYKYALLGLGIPFFIPFAPLFLQSPLVIAGTLLYLQVQDADTKAPDPLPQPSVVE